MVRRLETTALAVVLTLMVAGACGSSTGESAPAAQGFQAPATPENPGESTTDEEPLVVFLGDSITAGLHLPQEAAFPFVVQERLEARGLPFRLVNAGTSGDTSAGGLSRVDWLLRQSPEVVVVELGGNDGLRGVSDLEAIESNLRQILEKVNDAGATPLLLGMRIPSNYGPYAEDFAALYPRLAEETGVAFVPYFMEGVAGEEGLNLPDGIHPTAEGHRILAENVEDALAHILAGWVRD